MLCIKQRSNLLPYIDKSSNMQYIPYKSALSHIMVLNRFVLLCFSCLLLVCGAAATSVLTLYWQWNYFFSNFSVVALYYIMWLVSKKKKNVFICFYFAQTKQKRRQQQKKRQPTDTQNEINYENNLSLWETVILGYNENNNNNKKTLHDA